MSKYSQSFSCDIKNPYASYKLAKEALERLLRKDRIHKKDVEYKPKFHIYSCPYCSYWHIGHEVKEPE